LEYINKLWNIARFININLTNEGYQNQEINPSLLNNIDKWILKRLNQVIEKVNFAYENYKFIDVAKILYHFVWDEFAAWYLEMTKVIFSSDDKLARIITCSVLSYCLAAILKMLHPFMPFVTEEIYHQLEERSTDLCITQLAAPAASDKQVLAQGELLKNVISSLRDARNKNQVKPKETIKLAIETDATESYEPILGILGKQVNAEAITFTKEAMANSIVVAIEKEKFYITTDKVLDTTSLKNDLLKDLEYQKNFLASVEKKLANEKFVQNAKPEVIALERKKKADAEARIRTIKESLSTIS